MRLKQFNPNKELKKLNRKYTKKHLIMSLIVVVLLISIGSSYAIFSIQPEYHTFIKGTVGEFSTGDILLSVLVEGEKQDSFPAKDSGYTFESVTCENGTTGTWDNESWGLQVTFTKPDKCTVNFIETTLFADYIKNLYNSENEGSNGLYYHDGQGTYTNADQEIGDNSYRYSGANPNNYVCFGTDVYPCSEDNLYRIIGVFNNNVKLIKADYATTDQLGGVNFKSYFNKENYSNYFGSLTEIPKFSWDNTAIYVTNQTHILNYKKDKNYDVMLLRPATSCSGGTLINTSLYIDNLNGNFLESFAEKWKEKIESHLWNTYSNITLDNVTANGAYNYEIGKNKSNIDTNNAKIGLAYVNDYLYAASNIYWNYKSSGYFVTISENWLYSGIPEFLGMSTESDYIGGMHQYNLHYISDSGNISFGDSCNELSSENAGRLSYAAVRPTFYLNSDVSYVSGTGSENDPYIIN